MFMVIGQVISLLMFGLIPAVLLVGLLAAALPLFLITCKITEGLRHSLTSAMR